MYIRTDVAFNSDKQAILVDLLLPKSKPIFVGICYRPPKQMDFFQKLEKFLIQAEDFIGFESLILGDMNINILGNNSVKTTLLRN